MVPEPESSKGDLLTVIEICPRIERWTEMASIKPIWHEHAFFIGGTFEEVTQ